MSQGVAGKTALGHLESFQRNAGTLSSLGQWRHGEEEEDYNNPKAEACTSGGT